MRKIIHVDCDCFYAAVETLDNPRLRGIPIAVGGPAQSRGVIATCNYEARAFGVRSAMPSSQARRQCPSLLILPPRFDRYRAVSKQVQAIFQRYTDRVEPLSLDEAYLDVTGQMHCNGSATRMAEEIRAAVKAEIGITVSAGVAPNKFLAKIASEWRKPDGLFVVRPDQVSEFIKTLPVRKLHGVGKVTAQKLESMGLHTCADLQRADPENLLLALGSMGPYLRALAFGVDDRPVQVDHERKSVSVEHTFARDLPTLESCRLVLPALYQQMRKRLQKQDARQVKKAVVKVRFNDFTHTTRECRSDGLAFDVYETLLKEAFERGNKPVRLIGVGVRLGEDAGSEAADETLWTQLPLPLATDILAPREAA